MNKDKIIGYTCKYCGEGHIGNDCSSLLKPLRTHWMIIYHKELRRVKLLKKVIEALRKENEKLRKENENLQTQK